MSSLAAAGISACWAPEEAHGGKRYEQLVSGGSLILRLKIAAAALALREIDSGVK